MLVERDPPHGTCQSLIIENFMISRVLTNARGISRVPGRKPAESVTFRDNGRLVTGWKTGVEFGLQKKTAYDCE
jgi:hypothetical protein